MAGEAEIERMVVRLLGDASNYEQSLKRSGKATQTFAQRATRQLRTVSQGMKNLGRSLSLRVTAPLTVMGGISVLAFSRFDKAMTESVSIMDVTEKQIAKMKETAISLSADGRVLQGPADLAKSYFFLASAGKDAEQSMALLPKVSAFATAGTFDMALATDLLTDAQSALGLSSKDVAQDTTNLVRISDELVKANTLANASVQQFAESLTADAATASKIINAELETTIAILALYADKGKKAAESGNLFGRAVRLLTKSARDNADEFAKRGIRVVDEITGEYRNLIDIIEDMNQAFKGLTKPEIGKALSDLGFEALAQKSILPLLGATEQLKFYEAELKKARGITQEVADKQMKAFGNQMIVLKNQITVVGIEIGEILAPMILRLNEFVEKGISLWKNLGPEIKRTAVVIGLVTATIGPLLIVSGSLLGMIAFLANSARVLGVAFLAMGVKAQIGWAMATLGVSLIIPAIAGVTYGLVRLQQETGIFDPIIAAVKDLYREITQQLTPALLNLVRTVKKELGPVFTDLVKVLAEAIRDLLPMMVIVIRMISFEIRRMAASIQGAAIILGPLLSLLPKGEPRPKMLGEAIDMTTRPKMLGEAIDMTPPELPSTPRGFKPGPTKEEERAIKKATTDLESLRKEVFKLSHGFDDLDIALLDFEKAIGVSPELSEFKRLVFEKRMLDKAREKPLEMRMAAQVGTAEAQSRIMAFKAGTVQASDGKRTADNTERIANAVEEIRDHSPESLGLQPAGLKRS